MLLWRHFACSCFLVGREVNTIVTRVPYLWLKKFTSLPTKKQLDAPVGNLWNSDKYTNAFCYYFLLVWFAIKFVIVPVHLIDANMMLCKLALGFFSV